MGKLMSLGLWWIVEWSFSSVGTEYWISRINSDGAVVRDSSMSSLHVNNWRIRDTVQQYSGDIISRV